MALVKRADIMSKFNPSTPVQEQMGRMMVLSDAAHSLGAKYKGRKAGTLADVSVFSFHAVKNLPTAEGGAVALNLPAPFDNQEVYKYLCIYTLHGQTKDALSKMQKGNWRYDIIEAGFKCNMTDLMAAIGMIELARYEEDMLVQRQQICMAYRAAFSNEQWAELPTQVDGETVSSWHLFALRIKGITETQRDEIIQLIFDQDVSVNVHFIPLPMLSFYKNRGYSIADYPNAFDAYSREISLPVFYALSGEEIDRVIKAVKESVVKVISKKA
jgi:dTDP-4-amino-4,6-dideoxygalactose transaminase